MRRGFPKDSEIPAIFHTKVTIEQKPHLLLGNYLSPYLIFLAASLCNCQRQLIYVHGQELGPPPSLHTLEKKCEGNIPGKAQTFLR